MFGVTSPRSAALSFVAQAAKPCARLPHESSRRCTPSPRALSIRSRYALRVTRLRLTIRAVTSAMTGCSDMLGHLDVSGSILAFVPGATVAFDQRHRRAGTPTAGGVRTRCVAAGGPRGENRIGPAPCCFHFVAAHEQRGIAAHHVEDQPLVGVGLINAE